jgi:hypothetical protein
MHPNRLGAFAMQGAATRGGCDTGFARRELPTTSGEAGHPWTLLRALCRKLTALQRMTNRLPVDPRDLPPRMQGCDGHWEDPMLWLLIMH